MSRLLRSIAVGVVKGIAYYILVVYFAPMISYYLYTTALTPFMGGGEVSPPALPLSRQAFLAAGLLFLGLSVAASALTGTVVEPIIRAVSAILGFAFLLLILWGGTLHAEAVVEGAKLTVTMDLKPIVITYFVFVTVPSVILPLAWFLVRKAHSGEMHSLK
jgi:hypothetical protein